MRSKTFNRLAAVGLTAVVLGMGAAVGQGIGAISSEEPPEMTRRDDYGLRHPSIARPDALGPLDDYMTRQTRQARVLGPMDDYGIRLLRSSR